MTISQGNKKSKPQQITINCMLLKIPEFTWTTPLVLNKQIIMNFHICIEALLPKATDLHICKRCRHSILNQKYTAQFIVIHDDLGNLTLQSHCYQGKQGRSYAAEEWYISYHLQKVHLKLSWLQVEKGRYFQLIVQWN